MASACVESEDVSMEEDPDGVVSDGCTAVMKNKRRLTSTSSNEGNTSKTKRRPITRDKVQENHRVDTIDISTTVPEQQDKSELSGENSAKGRIIIVEPVGSEGEISSFIGKTIATYKLIEESSFGRYGIDSIKTNFKKKSFTIRMKTRDKVPELCQIHQLGKYRVKCFQPVSHTLVQGVIYQIGWETTMEEIVESIRTGSHLTVKAERIMKRRNNISTPTTAVKLEFMNMSNRPQKVFLGRQCFQVHPYIEKPMQCYNCQGFHHLAKNCFSKAKCVICAGPHPSRECTNKSQVKCSNCGGSHTASYAGCKNMKVAAEIQKIKANNDVTQKEAISIQRERSNPRQDEANQEKGKALKQGENAWNKPLQLSGEKKSLQGRGKMVEVGCQTESTCGTQTEMQNSEQTNGKLVSTMLKVVLKLMSCETHKERVYTANQILTEYCEKPYTEELAEWVERPVQMPAVSKTVSSIREKDNVSNEIGKESTSSFREGMSQQKMASQKSPRGRKGTRTKKSYY